MLTIGQNVAIPRYGFTGKVAKLYGNVCLVRFANGSAQTFERSEIVPL